MSDCFLRKFGKLLGKGKNGSVYAVGQDTVVKVVAQSPGSLGPPPTVTLRVYTKCWMKWNVVFRETPPVFLSTYFW